MSQKNDRISESTIARMAGNILSGFAGQPYQQSLVESAVAMARAIAAEVERTRPSETKAEGPF